MLTNPHTSSHGDHLVKTTTSLTFQDDSKTFGNAAGIPEVETIQCLALFGQVAARSSLTSH